MNNTQFNQELFEACKNTNIKKLQSLGILLKNNLNIIYKNNPSLSCASTKKDIN